ncbi:hypothetical protein LEN26_020189 [Aphanomyces euteiches]|nr:hypothetical protein LEN26_020189 [Aphanomyces euteiches]KAH9102426.1 hypothetical protein AeMF1_020986 [Aphanomyces euteiches]KAH9193046.1 hypothetical protein AeNC1_004975 [Aphanomyces euteiches]
MSAISAVLHRSILRQSVRSRTNSTRLLSTSLNPQLQADLQPAKYDASGRYPVTATGPGFLDLFKWMLTRKPEDGPRLPSDPAELDRTLPVVAPDLFTRIPADKARISWLGHASVLLQVPISTDRTFNLLTDPVFTERCSPSQWFGPARFRPAPATMEDLPPIDVVLISHNHYDHLETVSLRKLHEVQPDIRYFTPLGNAKWLVEAGIPRDNIVEQNWWDSSPVHDGLFQVNCVPAKHWSKRGFFDRNVDLWGGFVVQGAGGSFYFAGDTAIGTIFKAISHKFGAQSVSAIPIGAYAPRRLFQGQHCNVEEAIQIHRDVQSCASVGIHWGTWVLTGEYYLEPKEELERLMAKEASPDAFTTLDHGAHKFVQWKLD